MQPQERSQEQFSTLVTRFAGRPGVAAPDLASRRGFGSSALKVNGSIFAMLSGDRLVVKLPASRVTDLIREGTGRPFDGGKGRPMKEWLTVAEQDVDMWRSLAEEACTFVAARRR